MGTLLAVGEAAEAETAIGAADAIEWNGLKA
jgi:hypothetical protein